jgi:hypothetical protein
MPSLESLNVLKSVLAVNKTNFWMTLHSPAVSDCQNFRSARDLKGHLHMAHCDLDVLKHQFPIVKLFIYHLIYARIVRESYRTSQIQNEFWSLTSDAHLLRAVNYWCMVFGKDNEATHWKCLVKKSKDDVRAFREGLFRETGLDEDGWRDYWTGITTFRDKYAAHRELEPFTDPVPDFD